MSALPMPVPDGDGLLVRMEQAKTVLAEVRTVDDAKRLRDQAAAMHLYAQQQHFGLEAEVYAAEIRVRAERRIGQLAAALPTATGNQHASSANRTKQQALRDAGVEKQRASEWERLAALPDDLFEARLRQALEALRPISTAALLRLLAPETASSEPDAEPETVPPLPYTCEGCGKEVMIQVIHFGDAQVLRWFPAEKEGQDWYPDDDEVSS